MKFVLPLITFIGILFYTSQIHFAYLLCNEKETIKCDTNQIMRDNNCEYILDYVKKHPEIPCDHYTINWFNVSLTTFLSGLYYFAF
jgi:hypothetical protein